MYVLEPSASRTKKNTESESTSPIFQGEGNGIENKKMLLRVVSNKRDNEARINFGRKPNDPRFQAFAVRSAPGYVDFPNLRVRPKSSITGSRVLCETNDQTKEKTVTLVGETSETLSLIIASAPADAAAEDQHGARTTDCFVALPTNRKFRKLPEFDSDADAELFRTYQCDGDKTITLLPDPGVVKQHGQPTFQRNTNIPRIVGHEYYINVF